MAVTRTYLWNPTSPGHTWSPVARVEGIDYANTLWRDTMSNSRKAEKICTGCHKPFWSWGALRTLCLQCDPLPPRIARIFLRALDAGEIRL